MRTRFSDRKNGDIIGKLAADSSAATADIEKIILELCRDISDTVANIEAIRAGVDGQTQAADKVQEIFADFRMLAEKTSDSVRGMEELIEEMHQCDLSVVRAVERIQSISANTAGLTEKVADSLEEQLGESEMWQDESIICQRLRRRWSRR